MTHDELETRLRAMLSARADGIDTALTGADLRAASGRERPAATQQIGLGARDNGVRTAPSRRRPPHREDLRMTELHRVGEFDHGAIDIEGAPRRGRRLLLVSGAAVVTAAAAVAALLVAAAGQHTPRSHPSALGGASRPAVTRPATAAARHTAPPATWTYLHETSADGYTDVWIPSDQTHGVWGFKREMLDQHVSQRATCAAFPYFQTSTEITTSPSGKKHVVQGGVPPCDASSGWNAPYRPPFAESLPTDPKALLADMRRATGDGTDAETFDLGQGFIADGWVPKRIASNILAALELIPGVHEKRRVSNGAGTAGTAVMYTGRIKPAVSETWGIIVDPRTGEIIGNTFSYGGNPTERTGITRRTVSHIGATR